MDKKERKRKERDFVFGVSFFERKRKKRERKGERKEREE